jgi:hypothetical protein
LLQSSNVQPGFADCSDSPVDSVRNGLQACSGGWFSGRQAGGNPLNPFFFCLTFKSGNTGENCRSSDAGNG